jgi:hypothetical protein
MRKQGKRRTINYGLKPQAPVLVIRGIEEKKLEIRERHAADALLRGYGSQEYFLHMQDVLNLLLIAGKSSDSRQFAYDKADQEYKHAVASIQQRWEETGKWEATEEEHATLHLMISFARSFWMRQPMELLDVSRKELEAFYRAQNEARRAAA